MSQFGNYPIDDKYKSNHINNLKECDSCEEGVAKEYHDCPYRVGMNIPTNLGKCNCCSDCEHSCLRIITKHKDYLRLQS